VLRCWHLLFVERARGFCEVISWFMMCGSFIVHGTHVLRTAFSGGIAQRKLRLRGACMLLVSWFYSLHQNLDLSPLVAPLLKHNIQTFS
jgi:hypothetical protein